MELTLKQLYKILTYDEATMNGHEISTVHQNDSLKSLDVTLVEGSFYRILESYLPNLVVTENGIEVMVLLDLDESEIIRIDIYEFLQGERLREKIEQLIYVDNKLIIPWEIIDPKWGSAAMNKNGSVVLFVGSFTSHILRDESKWYTHLNDTLVLSDHIRIDTNHVEDWEKSLTIRL